ncbi:MAG: hypothetical protein H6Q78_585 [Candidatus Krumholzibacteriota bacterium]|nr:hypothetical protein [Candidatus Krumholzibacteriota bacterium]
MRMTWIPGPRSGLPAAALAATLFMFSPGTVFAHCDTMDGPVVKEALAALEDGDVTPVLKWVKKEHEAEIKDAFAKTRAARAEGPEAKEVADRWFLETLVRIHREGEGAPYTGLKPAGADLPHFVAAADKVVDGTLPVETLVEHFSTVVTEGLKKRYEAMSEAKKRANESVDAGRAYVAAYVEYVHYIEEITTRAESSGGHHHE